ncbi:Malectin-like domain, partial [Dillenia turbinata]
MIMDSNMKESETSPQTTRSTVTDSVQKSESGMLSRQLFCMAVMKVKNTPNFSSTWTQPSGATGTVLDSSRVYVKDIIIRAQSNLINVCLCCATRGSPFILTLELRPLNLSMHATDFEDNFFLKVAARINFGALTKDAISYPDKPYDRIWDSDFDRRQNYLVGVASGTQRINTSKYIDIRTRENPPIKTHDSSRGPLLNAIEISRYVEINPKMVDRDDKNIEGTTPSELMNLEKLVELYIQNNSFTGKIPAALLTGKIIFK